MTLNQLCPTTNGTSYDPVRSGEENSLLVGWFSMTRGFVSTVMSEPPIDQISELVEKENVDGEAVWRFLQEEAGFLACLIFALIFMIGIQISCCCVCCCRCFCKNCGGGNFQRNAKNVHCRRQTYSVSLIVCLIFISIGIACSLLSIDKGFKTVEDSEDTVLKVISNIRNFTKHTLKEATCVLTEGVADSIENTIDRLNDIKDKDGEPLKNSLLSTMKTELNPICVGIDKETTELQGHFKNLEDKLKDFGQNTDDLKVKATSLKTKFNSFKATCTSCDKIDPDKLDIKFPDDVNLNSVQKDKISVNEIVTHKTVTDYEQVIKEIEKVPQIVGDNTKEVLSSITSQLNQFKDSVTSGNNEILDYTKELDENLETLERDTKDLIGEHLDKSGEYQDIKKYSNVVTKCIFLLILVPTVFWFLGLILGIFGQGDQHYEKATRRGCSSNCGGIFLMMGVYAFFYLSALAMLLTALFFQVGGHLQVYVCSPLFEHDFKSFDKIYEIRAKNIVADNNITRDLRPSRILKDCKEDMAVVQALGLEGRVQEEVEKYLNLTDQTKFVPDMDAINLFNIDEPFEQLDEFVEIIDSVVLSQCRGLNEKLQLGQIDLKPFMQSVKDTIETLIDPQKSQLEQLYIDLGLFNQEILDSAWYQSEKLTTDALANVANVKKRLVNIPVVKENLKASISQSKDNFIHAVLKPGVDYIKEVMDKVTNDFAKCEIVWNTFDVGRNVLCKDLLDPFNGYWFGLGWCLFFQIFAVACAIKLSKHFYRMDKNDSQDDQYLTYQYDDGSKDRIENVYPMQGQSYHNQGFNEYR